MQGKVWVLRLPTPANIPPPTSNSSLTPVSFTGNWGINRGRGVGVRGTTVALLPSPFVHSSSLAYCKACQAPLLIPPFNFIGQCTGLLRINQLYKGVAVACANVVQLLHRYSFNGRGCITIALGAHNLTNTCNFTDAAGIVTYQCAGDRHNIRILSFASMSLDFFLIGNKLPNMRIQKRYSGTLERDLDTLQIDKRQSISLFTHSGKKVFAICCTICSQDLVNANKSSH